ncbi:MAG TPA: (Fe-S)-binding protein, partial [Nitrospirota bacterium]
MKERSLEQTSQDTLLEPFRKELSRCVKCGACRAVCPSFLAQREESLSARGRMALVSGVLEGRLSASGIYRDRLSTCMSCLACEAACPSGVPVTEIIQAAKEQALREAGAGIIDTIVAGFVKHPAAFRAAAWLAPAALHYTRGQGARDRWRKERSRSGIQGLKKQRSKGTIAFFPGCAVEYFQPDIEQATISILNAMGYDTIIPEGRLCCGRPLLSLGAVQAARGLAEQNNALLA